MGYYTSYDVIISRAKDSKQAYTAFKALEIISKYDFDSYNETCRGPRHAYLHAKWYTRSDDMQLLSMIFPNILFEIEGYGEDHGDFWRERWQNGIYERLEGEIVFPPFEKIK